MAEEGYDRGVPRLEGPEGTMPALGFGTWELTGEECRGAVKYAVNSGYRHVDTARVYENEREVGKGIQDTDVPRASLFVSTKVWRDDLAPDRVKESLDASLSDLQLDYVDLVMIHWPNPDVPVEETLGALGELRQEGKTCHIGLSNFNIPLLREAQQKSEAPIFCNQVEYHPYLSQEPILQYCRENETLVVAYSPLARGVVMNDLRLEKIAEKHNKGISQVVLRWLTQQPGVGAVVRSSKPDHILANLHSFDFRLDFQDMDQILQLERGQRLINPPFSPEWDT